MNVITTSTAGRKRQMVHVQEINPRSFLFFFEKGSTGFSYSLRDFSVPNHVTERYASDFGWTADEIRQKATHICAVPGRHETRGLARIYGRTQSAARLAGIARPASGCGYAICFRGPY